jgi:hypothetical protein
VVGAVLAALAMPVLSGCTVRDHRAAGIVERWLQAVSNQGRSAVRTDATERAAKYGDPGLAVGKLIPDNPDRDKSYFRDMEVGKAIENGATARVPVRLTLRLAGNKREKRTATVVVGKVAHTWRVVGVEPRVPGEKVPSEGGPLPARAKPGQWLAALVVGILLTVISVVVIELQPRTRMTEEA